jgi:glycosyltransferase involved in cell wall biosynthesis
MIPLPTERRVLTVIRWPVGGIRTYLLYNYPALVEAGYRFTFVGPGDGSLDQLAGDVRAWPGTEVVEAPVVRRNCRLRSAVRSQLLSRRFALIHSQGITAGIQTVLANLGLGVPHVLTSHDVIRANQYPGFTGLLKRRAMARILRRADFLIAVGRDALANHLEYLPGLTGGRCRLVAIRNGIDVARFASPPAPSACLRQRLRIPDGVPLIGFLGRFMEQKGFLVLVDALNRLAQNGGDVPFHLVAVGSGDYVREYRAEVEKRPALAGKITFLDAVADATPLLYELDLLVMPSLWEACTLLAMEALCAGLPLLGSDCIGLREVTEGTPTRSVRAGDPASLAAGLDDALRHPWREEAAGYAPLARQRFSVRQSVEELREVFDQCGGRRASGAVQGSS